MEIENKTASYLILFSKGRNVQRTSVVGVAEDEDLANLVRLTFKGRFKRPVALTPHDGVNIIIKKIDHIKKQISLVMNARIYNKSVRQARIEVEQAIRSQK